MMRTRVFLLLLVGTAIAGLFFIVGPDTRALAQTNPEDIWSQVVNLSHSGSAGDPAVAMDADGRVHVLWWDSFDGFVYTRGSLADWTTPTLLEVPFGTRRFYPDLRDDQPTPRFIPRLVVGQDDRIHAFWNDGEDTFFTSSAPVDALYEFEQWTERQALSEAILEYDVSVGQDGELYLVYLQTNHAELSPAGVYYRQLAEDAVWSAPQSIYQSIYYRSLEPGEAQLSVTAGDNGRVQVAWDDPHLGKIFHARSVSGGAAWSAPQGIVAQDDAQLVDEGESETAQLLLVDLVAAGTDTTHLIWQADFGDECALYHQASADGGASWDELDMLPGVACVEEKQVLLDKDGLLLIHLAGGSAQQWMLAWDGVAWSEPLSLPSEIEDPETGRVVQLGCLHSMLADSGQIIMIGCDLAGGGEIWIVSQTQGVSVETLFLAPTPLPASAWGTPVHVPLGEGENLIGVREPVLAADVNTAGRFHLIWSQTAENDSDGVGRALAYARWDVLEQERYPRPVILFASSEAKAEQPALAADADGRLHLVWRGGQAGGIMHSQAAVDTAFNPTNWAEPQLLPMPQPTGSWPAITFGGNGVIHVVFAIPFNEGRGIYYTQSADGGKRWTGPALVADGVKQGWSVVDHPSVAVDDGDTIHVTWSSLPLPGTLSPGAVHYARSSDGGVQWSEPLGIADGKVDWVQLVIAGGLEVHLVWAETDDRGLRLHRWSADAGQNWSRASLIPEMEGVDGPVGLVLDGARRIHVVAVVETTPGLGDSTATLEKATPSYSLQHRLWNGESWIEVAGALGLSLESLALSSPASAIATGDHLGLILASSVCETVADDDGTATMLTLLSRPLELPSVLPTPLPTLTPIPTLLPEPTLLPTPMPTPTPDLSQGGEARIWVGPISLGSDWAGLVLGAIPAALVVLVCLLGVWVIRGIRR